MDNSNTATSLSEYDPNLSNCGQFTKQTVRLVFLQWDARLEVTESTIGNATGMNVIESAISNFIYRLEDKTDDSIDPSVILTHPNGDTLECDGDGDLEQFLRDALVFAEILTIEPCESPFK